MLTAIFTFVTALVSAIFWFVAKILGFVFSLPVWLIVLTSITGLIEAVCIAAVIVYLVKKSNYVKKG